MKVYDDPDARRKAAMEEVADYRQEYPGDPRTDDELLVAPYGGYELADLDASLESYHEPRRRRLSESRPAPEQA